MAFVRIGRQNQAGSAHPGAAVLPPAHPNQDLGLVSVDSQARIGRNITSEVLDPFVVSLCVYKADFLPFDHPCIDTTHIIID